MIDVGVVIAILVWVAAFISIPALDRMRGSDTGLWNRNIAKFLLPFNVLVLLFGVENIPALSLLLFVPAYMLGASVGWGAPVGAGLRTMTPSEYRALVEKDDKDGTLEWYVRGNFKNSWLSSLIARGIIWAFLPSAVLAIFGYKVESIILFFVLTLSMPMGVLLANWTEGTKVEELLNKCSLVVTKEADKWGNQEILRGLFVSGALTLAVLASKLLPV